MLKVKKDGSWRDSLCEFVLKCLEKKVFPTVVIPLGSEVPRVREKSERPSKEEAIVKHQSRMALNKS